MTRIVDHPIEHAVNTLRDQAKRCDLGGSTHYTPSTTAQKQPYTCVYHTSLARRTAYLIKRKVSITPAPMPLITTAVKNEAVRAVPSIAHTAGSMFPSFSSPCGSGSVSTSLSPFAPSSVPPFSAIISTPEVLPSTRRLLPQVVMVVAAAAVPVSAAGKPSPDISPWPAPSFWPVSSSWVAPSPSSPSGSSLVGGVVQGCDHQRFCL